MIRIEKGNSVREKILKTDPSPVDFGHVFGPDLFSSRRRRVPASAKKIRTFEFRPGKMVDCLNRESAITVHFVDDRN